LRGITTVLEAVRERGEQRHAATERIATQVQQIEAELQALHKAIGNLSQRVRDQTVTLIRSSIPPSSPKSIAWRRRVVLALFVLAGLAVASMVATHTTAIGALANWLVASLTGAGAGNRPDATEPALIPASPQPPVPRVPTVANTNDAAPPAQSPTPPSPVAAGAPEPTASAPTGPAPVPPRVVLRAVEDAWVQVRHKTGRILLRRVMKQGEVWPVPAEPDLFLDTGNAGGIVVEVDGQSLPATGSNGAVVHDIRLDPYRLAASMAHPGP
jgi:hypothetical protein